MGVVMRWDEDERVYERELVEQDGESEDKTVEPRREGSRKRNSGKGNAREYICTPTPKRNEMVSTRKRRSQKPRFKFKSDPPHKGRERQPQSYHVDGRRMFDVPS